jgi:hypothetical protein
MLWLLLVVIIIAWVLGYTVWAIGTVVHVIFAIAVIAVLASILQGRRP